MNNHTGIGWVNLIPSPVKLGFWVLSSFPLGSLCPFWHEVKRIAKKNPDKAFFPYRGSKFKPIIKIP
jgi:hypothetical protein